MPDLFAGRTVTLFGRYGTPGQAMVSLAGVRAGQAWSAAFDVTLPDYALDGGYVPRVWALRQVGRLLADIKQGNTDPLLATQVMALRHPLRCHHQLHLFRRQRGGRRRPSLCGGADGADRLRRGRHVDRAARLRQRQRRDDVEQPVAPRALRRGPDVRGPGRLPHRHEAHGQRGRRRSDVRERPVLRVCRGGGGVRRGRPAGRGNQRPLRAAGPRVSRHRSRRAPAQRRRAAAGITGDSGSGVASGRERDHRGRRHHHVRPHRAARARDR